jgi:putative addiction module component (TIGR02574 family)
MPLKMNRMKKNDDLVTRVLELPEPERASLARQLLLSLEPPDFDSDSETAWAVELEARIASVKAGRFRASDWRKALKRIRQALAKGATS